MTSPDDKSDPVARAKINRVWSGIGSSMLPFVLPGSRLHLRLVGEAGFRVRKGDVICYLGSGGRIVAHRVVAIRNTDNQLEYVAKGDAQGWTEHVSPQAVFAAVERVDQPLFSYRTGDTTGRAIAFFATTAPSLISAAGAATRLMMSVARKLNRAR